MPPTDLRDLETERHGDPLALLRARRPTAVGNRGDALDVHSGAGRQVLDGQPTLLQQMLNGSHTRKCDDLGPFMTGSLYQRMLTVDNSSVIEPTAPLP